jgi:predicted transcriptional regulator
MTITAKGYAYLWKLSPSEIIQYMHLKPQFTMDMCIKISQRLGYTNLLLRHLAAKTANDSDEDEQAETLQYMWRKLKEKNEALQEKNRQLKELRGQLKSIRFRTPSLFLRGQERGGEERSAITMDSDTEAEISTAQQSLAD